MDALLGRIEVDRALDVGGDELLAAAVAEPDRLRDSANARAREAEAHIGRRGLEVVVRDEAWVHMLSTVPGGL